jgi:signal transduction histidine kinase
MAVLVAVAGAGLVVAGATRTRFEQAEEKRTVALVEQFRREFTRRGAEIADRVKGIANSDAITTITISGTAEVDTANSLAGAHSLDFLELVDGNGRILSSKQCPASFDYKEEWLTASVNWNSHPAFLKREECLDDMSLALLAVHVVNVGEQRLYVVGGERLDVDFVKSLTMPEGMRALLYRNLAPELAPRISSAAGPVQNPEKLAPVIERVRKSLREVTVRVNWTKEAKDAETIHAVPLTGRQHQFLGALLIGSSRKDLVELERFLLWTAIVMGAAGVLLGVVLGWWATARVTRPVQELAEGARAVAHGELDVRVPVRSRDEIGQLAFAFNLMTGQLVEQRDRLVQAERVAAWRELARRLAHELKNPLFPLQLTVENMQRARESHPEQFDEVFEEGTTTLLAELGNLKQIIARFSDFAKMPRPQTETMDLNALAAETMKLFEAQLATARVTLTLALESGLPAIQADPGQLSRVLRNLVLNAIDAMPEGGALAVRTWRLEHGVRLEVADTGQGLTPEECQRLFTPYYTSKQHGTGLGLAIVQSVVSDHGGRISVESEPGRGTTFRIELAA